MSVSPPGIKWQPNEKKTKQGHSAESSCPTKPNKFKGWLRCGDTQPKLLVRNGNMVLYQYQP